MVSLDKDAKTATLAGGRKIRYEALLSTMPLDLTLQWLGQQKWAAELSHRCAPCAHVFCWTGPRTSCLSQSRQRSAI